MAVISNTHGRIHSLSENKKKNHQLVGDRITLQRAKPVKKSTEKEPARTWRNDAIAIFYDRSFA